VRCRKGYSRLYLCMWHLSLHTGTKDRNIFLIDHFKCKKHSHIHVLRLSWHLFFKRWTYFGFYSHIVMKGFDFSEKRTSTIFRATEMFQVDVEVMRNNEMYRLFTAYFLPPHHLSNH